MDRSSSSWSHKQLVKGKYEIIEREKYDKPAPVSGHMQHFFIFAHKRHPTWRAE